MVTQVALITGGAQGLGKAFAQKLLSKGVKVALLDVDEGKGQETVSEFTKEFGDGKAVFYTCDVSDADSLKEKFESAKSHFGGLDIVINNAGIVREAEGWEKAVDVNLNAVIRGTQLAAELMGKDTGGKGGLVLNIASLAGLSPVGFMPVYCATKAAMIHFSLACASKTSYSDTKGIRVNVFAPAFVDTNIVSGGNATVPPDVQALVEATGGLMTTEYAADALMELIDDTEKNGAVLTLSKTKGKEYHPTVPGFPSG